MKVEWGRGVKLGQEDDKRGSTKIRYKNAIGKLDLKKLKEF